MAESQKSRYETKFYTGNYDERQRAANADKAICYVEQHFNSGTEKSTGSEVVVATNASQTSKDWGTLYAKSIAEEFQIPLRRKPTGLLIGGYKGRGNFNLRFTHMPAILLEPLFVSNPDEAAIVKVEEGRQRLAKVLVDTIKTTFPQGGLVAFSIGHIGKRSNPRDRGAAVHGSNLFEGDYAHMVLQIAEQMLIGNNVEPIIEPELDPAEPTALDEPEPEPSKTLEERVTDLEIRVAKLE